MLGTCDPNQPRTWSTPASFVDDVDDDDDVVVVVVVGCRLLVVICFFHLTLIQVFY